MAPAASSGDTVTTVTGGCPVWGRSRGDRPLSGVLGGENLGKKECVDGAARREISITRDSFQDGSERIKAPRGAAVRPGEPLYVPPGPTFLTDKSER